MKLALSILCEHPARKTGLTTLFHEFVAQSLEIFPELQWLIFAGPNQPWTVDHPRVEVCRAYPANDRLARRLLADHLLAPAAARRAGADALLTVGFLPLRDCLPAVMHVFSLQHVRGRNKVGLLRGLYRAVSVRRGLERARLVVTNSQWAASEILRDCPSCASRLTVSYEGLQHEQFHPEGGPGEAGRVQSEFGFGPGYLLWVSNFYAYKQAPLLLEAYARLTPEMRRRHPLVMVGGEWHGGLIEAKAQAERLGIAGDVRFLGWIADEWLAPLYRQARAFVLASREETFGRCVAEAMACGTPCVVNAIPIMAEVTGGFAVLTDFASTADAARALETICADEPLREKLRTGGRQWVQKFRFDVLARERITAIAGALDIGASPRVSCDFMRFKMTMRAIVIAVARRFGSRIIDSRTGKDLGRAFLVPFRGKIHVIGLDAAAIPLFLEQERLTYWKQELGFTAHPPPDFPHEPRA